MRLHPETVKAYESNILSSSEGTVAQPEELAGAAKRRRLARVAKLRTRRGSMDVEEDTDGPGGSARGPCKRQRGGQVLSKEERKQQRMIANRESARASRMRQKEEREQLLRENNALRQQLEAMRAVLAQHGLLHLAQGAAGPASAATSPSCSSVTTDSYQWIASPSSPQSSTSTTVAASCGAQSRGPRSLESPALASGIIAVPL
mmetsp:Transcript_2205/g.6544  ORF Transcript_2205/g.6544 Transcript_2205/m.6544 type:complete len:204 (-) Transcript_2205:726-1337(-)